MDDIKCIKCAFCSIFCIENSENPNNMPRLIFAALILKSFKTSRKVRIFLAPHLMPSTASQLSLNQSPSMTCVTTGLDYVLINVFNIPCSIWLIYETGREGLCVHWKTERIKEKIWTLTFYSSRIWNLRLSLEFTICVTRNLLTR